MSKEKNMFIIVVTVIVIISSYLFVLGREELEQDSNAISIINAYTSESIVYKGEAVGSTVLIQNSNASDREVWLGYSLQGPTGTWYDIEAKHLLLPARQTITEHMEWRVLEDALSGAYTIVVAVWDNPPSASAKRLASVTLKEGVRIYNSKEDFQTWPNTQWLATDSRLGRSRIQSKNVSLQEGKLRLTLPKDTLNGAEIRSKEKVHYGSYEIRMKIPDAPSSITGFFLYDQPDYYKEIDIELYNQPEGNLFFTIYAQGGKAQSEEQSLPFDPTEDFHTYRIDYFPDRVDFLVDGTLMQTWSQGFTDEPMYLMVNVWYPKWLEGRPSDTDSYLLIDWILQ